jgi:hypothetical protein
MTAISGVVKQIQRLLTLEQQAEVVRRYQAGTQMSYLAQHFGVHRSHSGCDLEMALRLDPTGQDCLRISTLLASPSRRSSQSSASAL